MKLHCADCDKETKNFYACDICEIKIICYKCKKKNEPKPHCDVENVCNSCNQKWSVVL